MFQPPRCPNLSCPNHAAPKGRFFWRHGSFGARCRIERVPRFRCRGCRRTFSVQTFRHDRGDRRPDCNQLLFQLLTSSLSLRQSARLVKLSISGVQKKMRKLARTCRNLHRNLCAKLPPDRTFLLDEEETYEGASIRPLTMPVLMERKSWFIVATTAGRIRRLAPDGTRRRRLQEREERRHGERRDRSKLCVQLVLGRLAKCVPEGAVTLRSDEKSSYRTVAKDLLGERLRHETTRGRRPRTTANPLFPINTTMAMTRDNCGRLRRKTWLVTKKGRYLRQQMHLFVAYRNYVRKRFNRDPDDKISSAVVLELLSRAIRPSEIVRWRQDWGMRSIHPQSFDASATVADSLQPAA